MRFNFILIWDLLISGFVGCVAPKRHVLLSLSSLVQTDVPGPPRLTEASFKRLKCLLKASAGKNESAGAFDRKLSSDLRSSSKMFKWTRRRRRWMSNSSSGFCDVPEQMRPSQRAEGRIIKGLYLQFLCELNFSPLPFLQHKSSDGVWKNPHRRLSPAGSYTSSCSLFRLSPDKTLLLFFSAGWKLIFNIFPATCLIYYNTVPVRERSASVRLQY